MVNIRKYEKTGLWRGAIAEMKMIADAASVLTPFGLVRQNLDMLKLVSRPSWRARVRGLFAPRLAS